ncbi:MAG: AMP-binding protein [Gammaproteobacteria bacterium]|nr:AMP-binding protein [Gammaproteobacteria bacterium]
MSTHEHAADGARNANADATVRALIARRAADAGESIYIVAPESNRTLTYAALLDQSNRIAARLDALGLGKGDTVSLMLGNGAATAELMLGAMFAGCKCAPLNTAAGAAQLGYILEHSRTNVVFVSPDNEALLADALAVAGLEVRIVVTDVDHGPQWPAEETADYTLPELSRDDDAMLVYTSGTTGKPKGVLLTHANVLSGARNVAGAHALQADDCGLCVLPLCHINAQIVSLLGILVSGGTMVLPHGFSVSRFWGWIADLGCTWFSVVPTIIAYLLHEHADLDAQTRSALQSVRFGRSASAPLPPALHEQFESRFGIPIVETMGITEAAAQILTNPLPPTPCRVGSPGLPYGNEVIIADDDDVELGPDEQGEILVRGANVMRGYLRDPEATAAALNAEGWLRTGDLGHKDEDGFVFVTGRLKELIIKGGENISPREVDDALFSHPAVVEAGALGIPDADLGEEVAACVVVRDDMPVEEQELIEHCRKLTGAFKAPRRILFMRELPKGPTGKVLRHELAKLIAADNNETPAKN